MTGYDIYKRAVDELSGGETAENTVFSLPESALGIVNDIGSDLIEGFATDDIFEEITVEKSVIPAFTYGIAMMISALTGLYEKNAFFTELYNLKRSAVKASVGRIKNVVPTA